MKNQTLLKTQPNPQVVLITGGTGAGKTTYALKLAREITGIRFSIDDWMTDLFWMDAPDNGATFEWAMDRIRRAETVIRQVAEQILASGQSVILDLGFTKTQHRQAFADWASDLGVICSLHWIDIPSEERWRRVQSRNSDKGETFAMDVTRDMFDFMESQWEVPSAKLWQTGEFVKIDL